MTGLVCIPSNEVQRFLSFFVCFLLLVFFFYIFFFIFFLFLFLSLQVVISEIYHTVRTFYSVLPTLHCILMNSAHKRDNY